jgi:type I restriction enzyme S subunit
MSDWFGTLPEHWYSKKINNLFVERRDKVSDADYPPLSVSKGGVVPQIATVAKTDDGNNRKLVKKSDFAINSRSDRRGSSGVSQHDGSVSLINIVLKPRAEENGDYFHYLLRSHLFIEEYYRNGRGIVADLWTTRYDEMKTIYLPVPPRYEQGQIVRFLDWKVSQINKLINAKQKQFLLLQEQKQTIINHVVTKGLDPNAPTKNSGVAWIGDAPRHWSISAVGHLYNSILGKMLAPTKRNAKDTLEHYLCAKDVHFDSIDITKTKEMWFSPLEKERYRVAIDDLLVVEGGAGAGGAFVFNELSSFQLYVQNSIQVLRPKTDTLNRFLCYWIQAIVKRGYIEYACNKATIPHLTKDKLLAIPFPFAPVNEQAEIVEVLDCRCTEIDGVIQLTARQISLLLEYRTRLISDVVTGKLDVRDVMVPEYGAVEEIFTTNEMEALGDERIVGGDDE